MPGKRSFQIGYLGTLALIACFSASHVAAQSETDLPTAKEIWRHLPGQTAAPASPPAPAPKTTPAASVSPRQSAPAAAPRRSVPKAIATGRARTLAQARVVIHYPESGGYERSEELVRLLRALGAGEVETRPVRYAVEQQSIRYFHAADREVSGVIGDLVGGGGRATVSDFTFYQPSPRGGTVEVWLP